jgi:MYXO-CTERM domain-containing protein
MRIRWSWWLRMVLVVLLGVSTQTSAWAAKPVEQMNVYVVWLKGEGEANRVELDSFFDCLFSHSDLANYWNGDVRVEYEGSIVTAPPTAIGDAKDIPPFIEKLIANKELPANPPTGKPVYLVLVDPAKTSTVIGVNGVGGRNTVGKVNGKTAGLAIVTTNPAGFWSYRSAMGNETQGTMHELVEVIDGVLGKYECAGDCCCNGWCNNGPACGNLTGLSCPGAPATTKTGCAGTTVKGWVIQKLSHQGQTTCTCPITCDFTVGQGCATNDVVLTEPCMQTSQCCTGTSCEKWSIDGKGPGTTTCCKSVGDKCTRPTDCCGSTACGASGTCECIALGKACMSNVDCCDGNVCDGDAGVCAKAPVVVDAGSDAQVDAGKPAVDASGSNDASPEIQGDSPSDPAGCACDVTAHSDSRGASVVALGVVLLALRRKRSA